MEMIKEIYAILFKQAVADVSPLSRFRSLCTCVCMCHGNPMLPANSMVLGPFLEASYSLDFIRAASPGYGQVVILVANQEEVGLSGKVARQQSLYLPLRNMRIDDSRHCRHARRALLAAAPSGHVPVTWCTFFLF